MITKEGYERLLHFIIWCIVGTIVAIIGASNVFALTYTNVAELRDITQQLVSTNYGNAPYTNPINSGYAFNEVLQVDYIISNYNFVANTNYQLESHLTNQQLDNANYYSVQGLNGETCLISYQNSIFQDAYPRWAFQCPHNTNTITITIKNSSNQYLWSGTGIFNWTTALLKSSDTPLNGGGNDTDAIINNNNQNTQDIINNNNSNTDRIIEENNKNFNTCRDSVNLVSSYYINNALNQYATILNIKADLKPNTDYTLSFYGTAGNKIYVNENLFTNNYWNTEITNNKTILHLHTKNEISTSDGSQYNPTNGWVILKNSQVQTNDITFREIQLQLGNNATDYEEYGKEICTNKLDEQKDAINNLDDTLKDDSVDENGVADAFDSFNDFLDDNSTITQLITLPITLYTAILNNLNGTCQPFNLGKLYGEDLILPCINISQYLGNSLWTMIDIIISGFAVYAISKKMIKVFNNFSSLREGDVIDD